MSEGYRFLKKGRHLSPHMEYILAYRRLEEINQKENFINKCIVLFTKHIYLWNTRDFNFRSLISGTHFSGVIQTANFYSLLTQTAIYLSWFLAFLVLVSISACSIWALLSADHHHHHYHYHRNWKNFVYKAVIIMSLPVIWSSLLPEDKSQSYRLPQQD